MTYRTPPSRKTDMHAAGAMRSCLARIVPSGPTSPEGLEVLRQRAWSEQGVVVLNLDEIADDWLRQAVKNEATKRWGRRMRR